MDHHSGHVMTLANSIIGVSILAMPYCFQQCGILLAIIMLLLSSLISRLACHFLLKSAILARRKTFEYLAYYIFGGVGKFAIEVGIIGFLIGTCIAFFVVMGDLGPEIISEITGRESSSTMRTSILMALALFCALPLGLLRKVDSLNGVSRATIGFYFFLVLKIVVEALPHLFSGDWIDKVEIWRPAGIIQCLPIFSMALSCQTQLFEIYKVVQNPTLENMNHVVKGAVNICTLVYFFVGFFGYVTFANKQFTGNILLSFTPSLLTSVIKIGFILSIAFSFPLVIFPCRASLHSLIYREGFSVHEGSSNYIPEGRFKVITMFIVFVSLIVGILIPNIELVLGLVGSTIGIMICVLFPVICFIHISQKNTNERLLAQLVLVVGFVVMVLGTYENLHGLERMESPIIENLVTEKRELTLIDSLPKDLGKDVVKPVLQSDVVVPVTGKLKQNQTKIEIEISVKVTVSPEIRHEPPQPIEPQEEKSKEQIKHELVKDDNIKKKPENTKVSKNFKDSIIEEQKKSLIVNQNVLQEPQKSVKPLAKQILEMRSKNQAESKNVQVNRNDGMLTNDTKSDEVDIEAIKKDDKEMQLQRQEQKDLHVEEHKILLDTLQKQNEVQEEMMKQQKKLIEVIEKQQEQQVKEEKLKAVKEIESIALKAIEQISGDAKENKKIVEELEKNVIEKVAPVESELEIKQEKGEHKENIQDQEKSIVTVSTKKTVILVKSIENNIPETIPVLANENVLNPKLINLSQIQKLNLKETRTTNNTAPLFLNLGQKSNNDKKSIKELMPLPMVVSHLEQNESNFSNTIINITSSSKVSITDKIIKNDNVVGLDLGNEAKVMRRDILSFVTKN